MNLFKYHSNPETLRRYKDRHLLKPMIKDALDNRAKITPEQLEIISTDAHLSFVYIAYNEGVSFDKGKETISKDPDYSYRFWSEIINGQNDMNSIGTWYRWPMGEKAISSVARYAYDYVISVFNKRWPMGEDAIAAFPIYAEGYARNIIKDKWPMGEDAIATDPSARRAYNNFLKHLGYSDDELI